eukprot:TRINITY_DN49471_c0_g1_i3.p1 TRINITY_DN49471_c0_g1~~TRINITY_DN49471_c0_g1_i3.p1  ORF type:complete len:162 (-),score=47.84 TRINITY_DN49471_c0_g1_i3:288-773(-)
MSHLSKEERRLYTEVFLDNDEDGNGYLSVEEFMTSDLSKLGFTKSDQGKMVQITFGLLDKNRDGRITLDEYFVICSQLPVELRQKAELRRMFQNMDSDVTGTVSEQEFANYLHRKGTLLSPRYIHTIFQLADKNKDGQLTYKELMESSLGPGESSSGSKKH